MFSALSSTHKYTFIWLSWVLFYFYASPLWLFVPRNVITIVISGIIIEQDYIKCLFFCTLPWLDRITVENVFIKSSHLLNPDMRVRDNVGRADWTLVELGWICVTWSVSFSALLLTVCVNLQGWSEVSLHWNYCLDWLVLEMGTAQWHRSTCYS